MTKRQVAMTHALAIVRFCNQVEKQNQENPPWGMQFFNFWLPNGPKQFKSTKDMRLLANKIVRSVK